MAAMDKCLMPCRLCGGDTGTEFVTRVLQKYDVSYFKCLRCRSLQTERPYWIQEAYSTGNLVDTDTGSVLRNLNSAAIIFSATKILGFSSSASIVDVGGGVGMLTRLLRDQGYDARWSDAYATNNMARGFDDDGRDEDIICSFEVAEHLIEPATDLQTHFDRHAQLVIIGTETYQGQGADWWYVSPWSGQHIFFYSEAGMAVLGKKFGYCYERIGSVHVFTRVPMTRMQGRLLWRAISPTGLRFVRAWLAFRLSAKFVGLDWTMLSKR
jgi:hypothetical protein